MRGLTFALTSVEAALVVVRFTDDSRWLSAFFNLLRRSFQNDSCGKSVCMQNYVKFSCVYGGPKTMASIRSNEVIVEFSKFAFKKLYGATNHSNKILVKTLMSAFKELCVAQPR